MLRGEDLQRLGVELLAPFVRDQHQRGVVNVAVLLVVGPKSPQRADQPLAAAVRPASHLHLRGVAESAFAPEAWLRSLPDVGHREYAGNALGEVAAKLRHGFRIDVCE